MTLHGVGFCFLGMFLVWLLFFWIASSLVLLAMTGGLESTFFIMGLLLFSGHVSKFVVWLSVVCRCE
jgi:hypothetical protein